MKFTGASLTLKLLERQGITRIAGIPGGANLPLYDALYASPIQHTLARHEQGAGFIAQGMARASGEAAVCFATSGPGVMNVLTAIADAKMDSVPLIAICGQVPLSMIGTDAFQEIDTYGLTVPITKHNFLVRSVEELLFVIPEAFRIANSGRKGPVVVDIPKDVQNASIELEELPEPGRARASTPPTVEALQQFEQLLARAESPVMYVGGGVIASNAAEEVRTFARRHALPVVSTLMGLGSMRDDDPLHLGMLGMHAAPFTNRVLEECDLLIAVGVRFDDRATGKVEQFCPGATIVHVDIDRSEFGKIKQPLLAMECDVADTFRALNHHIRGGAQRSRWLSRVAELRRAHPLPMSDASTSRTSRGLIAIMARCLAENALITTDVGQHQMWVAQYYPFTTPRQFATSGGLGTMGFGLPAAIGMALQCPDRTVVCVSGDGSFLMNIQELATLAEENLNVKTIVMDNGHLGLVRQQQELFYGGRYSAARFETKQDLAAVARAFGVRGIDLGTCSDPEAALEEALRSHGPYVIRAPIDALELVLPMVPPGAANRDMIERRPHG